MLKNRILIAVLAVFLWGCQKQEALVAIPPTDDPSPTASACCLPLDSGPFSDSSLYHLESSWTDQDSRTLELGSLRGKVVLVALIYSSCKGACPMILEDMRKIEARVAQGHPDKLHYLLVSIDPEVDTPEKLKAYSEKAGLGPSWTFLNGQDDDILELAALLGVKYKKTSETDYAHSNIISVLNPQGEIVHQQEGLNIDPTATVEAIDALLQHH